MMNQVVIVGRLTSDPELKENENKKWTQITVAVSRNFKNADGVYETDFIPCILWSNIASNTVEYCKKGDIVGIKGRMQTRTSKDKEGNSNVSLEVIADRVTFLSSLSKNKNSKNPEDRDER